MKRSGLVGRLWPIFLSMLRTVLLAVRAMVAAFLPSGFFIFVFERWAATVSGERLRRGRLIFQGGTILISLMVLAVCIPLGDAFGLSLPSGLALVLILVNFFLSRFAVLAFGRRHLEVESNHRYKSDDFPADKNALQPVLGFHKSGYLSVDLSNVYTRHFAIFGDFTLSRDSLNFLLISRFLKCQGSCVLVIDSANGGVDFHRLLNVNGLLVESSGSGIRSAMSWLQKEFNERSSGKRLDEPLFVIVDDEISGMVLPGRQGSYRQVFEQIIKNGRKHGIFVVMNFPVGTAFRDLGLLLPFFTTITFHSSYVSGGKGLEIPNFQDVAGVYLNEEFVLTKFIACNQSDVAAAALGRRGSSVTYKLAVRAVRNGGTPIVITNSDGGQEESEDRENIQILP